MDKRYLEYILALAETGNMTRAARSSYVSQPTLSQFLAKQEQEIGAPLFQRSGGVYTLTPVETSRTTPVKVLALTHTLEKDIERISATRSGSAPPPPFHADAHNHPGGFPQNLSQVELAMVNATTCSP